MSKLHFKYGAMNSGKSTALINAAYNYEEQGHQVLVTKPSVDKKGDVNIVARAKLTRKVDFLSTPELDIRKKLQTLGTNKKYNCLFVDEAQFLTPEQVDQLLEIAKFDDVSVIAYGLRADFQSKMFPGSKRLMEVADNIEKLPTMCICGSQAEFNTRIIDGRYVFSGDQVAIDGLDATYNSLCGKCYLSERKSALLKHADA